MFCMQRVTSQVVSGCLLFYYNYKRANPTGKTGLHWDRRCSRSGLGHDQCRNRTFSIIKGGDDYEIKIRKLICSL
jgi:hypothetical protein